MQAAARTLGVQLHILRASNERDIDDAFATLAQLRAGAFVISSDPFFNSRAEQFAQICKRLGSSGLTTVKTRSPR
jgi:hypothetical protein